MEPDDDKTQSFILITDGTAIGNYRILNKIGAGGMGEVWLAEDAELKRKVALKFLPPHLCQDEDCRTRFKREAQAAAKLNHPNIITIHEVGEYKFRPYMVMEHIIGKSLRDMLKEHEVTVEKAIKITLDLCEGLNKAHQEGIIHRDIKPSNIIIDSEGRVKLLDFGLATIQGEEKLTKTGSTLGTVGYMSPEQVKGDYTDHRSDLFSVGVVLYELITGRRPFEGEGEAAVLNSILNTTPEPLARYKKNVSDMLQQVVDKALDKDKETRYQTAAGMLADLKRVKKELEPGGITGQAVMPKKRYGKILIPSLVVIIALLLLIFQPWKFEISPRQEAIAQENKLAIMYFDNLADPDDSLKLGEITTNLLITDLSESEYVQVVSSQRLYDILKQLGHEGEKKIDRNIATQVAQKAKAKWMLLGSILNIEPEIILTAQLIDVASGDAIASQRIEGQPGDRIFPLVDKLTVEIKNDLSLPVQALEEEDRPVIEYTTNSVEAYRYYLEGFEYKIKYYDKEAEECYRKAVEIDSTFAMAYMMLLELTDSDEQKYILSKMNQFADNVTHKEKLYIKAFNAFYKDVKDEDGYIKFLSEIVEKYPEDKLALYYLAWYYHNPIGEIDKAKELFEKLIQLDPYFGDAYNHLAYIYAVQNIPDSSIWAINKFIELADPDEANPYDTQGELYGFHGELERAIASFKRALEIKPDFRLSLHKLGNMYLFKNDYNRAESLYREMASHSDENVRAYGRFCLHRIPFYQGRFNEALRKLEIGLETDRMELGFNEKWLEKIRQKLHIYGHYLGDMDRALRIIDTLFSIRDEFPSYDSLLSLLNYDMAWLYAKKGDFKKADSYLTTIENVSNATGIGYLGHVEFELMQGLIAFEKGNYDYAINTFKKVKQNYPIFFICVYLARSYFEGGYVGDAVIEFEDVLIRYDGTRAALPALSVLAHYWTGKAYEASGWNDKAIEQYETFLDIWKNADPGIEEIDDAKVRLARLKDKT